MLFRSRPAPTEAATPPIIAVNLSLPDADEPEAGEAERIEELTAGLKPFVRDGWRLRPYALNPSDVAPTRRLMAGLSYETAPVTRLTSASAAFEYLGPATCNVAVRLHGAVLGCCLGVPPLVLGYRDKCLDFAESMELERWHVSLSTGRAGEVTSALRALTQVAPTMRDTVIERALALKQRLCAYADRVAHQTRDETR